MNPPWTDIFHRLRWLAPPPRIVDEENRPRQAYFVTLAVLFVGLAIGLLDLRQSNSSTLLMVLAGLPGILVVLWMIGNGYAHHGVSLLLLIILMVLTVVLSLQNGIHDVGVVLYPVIAMVAGAMIGRKALGVFLALVTLSVFFVVGGELYGYLPAIHRAGSTSLQDGVTVTLIMLIAAIAIRLLVDAPARALARASASEESLTDKVRKLQLLREISLLYAKELDLRTLVQRIYEIFPQYFVSTTPNVLVHDDAAGGLISDAQLGVKRGDRPTSAGVTKPGESISGLAFLRREPVLVHDCRSTDIIPREWVERLGLRSCLAVPIVVQDQALGVLRLDNCERPGAFAPDDVAFFEMLADQLAIGIQNQRLFEERHRAQAALAEGESRFRMLSENVTDVIWTSDLQLRFRYISDSVEKMFGWTPAEWLRHTPEVYLVPESLEIVQAEIRRELTTMAREGTGRDRVVVLELRQRRKDGSEFWTEVVARVLRNAQGQPDGFIGVTRDINDRKHAEERLKDRVQQLRLLRELGVVYSQVLDLKTFSEKIYEIVPRFRRTLNITIMFYDATTETLVGDGQLGISRHGVILPPGVQHAGESISGLVMRDRRPIIIEDCRQTDLIPKIWVEAYGMRSTMALPIMFQGQFLGVLRIDDVEHIRAFDSEDLEFFGMLADQIAIAIENHRLFEARREAEGEVRILNEELERRVFDRTAQLERANQELEAFSYSVSHDLRAPIRHILGFLKLLEDEADGALGESAERHLRTVERSAQRMAQLIDDLLRLSRLSRAEMRAVPTDLTNLVTMLWSRLESADPSRSIIFKAEPTTCVSVDPGLMEVALENLLSNARKFTSKHPEPRVEFGELRGDDGPVFYVRDNGAGFDMAYARKLFGVFQRLHDSDEFPGTGIGLATVNRILERHHGRIWAEAEVDRGATFYFTASSHEDVTHG